MPDRDQEEEFFAKQDREKLAALKARWQAEAAADALAARRDLHHHKCGKCGADMDTRPFKGIEIEVCVECNSVLLDPGELEQLAGQDQGKTLSKMLSIFGGK